MRRREAVVLGLTLGVLATGCPAKPKAAAGPVRVAAAADLEPAFTALGRRFTERTGVEVVFSFGSTGLLQTQLKEGAPFDLFAAANTQAVDALVTAGVCDGSSAATFAVGAIVLYSPTEPLASLAEVTAPRFRRVALAQPEHAPYGLAAQQLLVDAGLWDALVPRLVYGQNIAQALQYAQTGNAEAAFVSRSLAAGLDGGTLLALPASGYAPLTQRLAVCRGGARAADAVRFAQLITSDEGRAVLERSGFTLPAR